MKAGGGKNKGNNFESQVAKKLSSALAPLNFMRTPGSGARVGGKNFATIGQMFGDDALKLFVGDVVPLNERDTGLTFNFSVECKTYKEPDGWVTLVAGNANVFKWMQESIDDASKIDKRPMIVFKWNRTPIFVGVLSGTIPNHKPQLTISQALSIDIFYLDDLLKDASVWVKGLPPTGDNNV